MDTMANDTRSKIQVYVRNHFQSAMASLGADQIAKTNALKLDLAARGCGLALDPLDPRFDDIETAHCDAVLQAKATALFEAYEVYGLPIDDLIMKELNSHQRQLVDARTNGLKATATGRALRTGRDTGPDTARAAELGRKIERSTHAALKKLSCEVEKRRQMPTKTGKEENGPTFNQNIVGHTNHVTQHGDSISSFDLPKTKRRSTQSPTCVIHPSNDL
jgi:hypothetical protein